MGEQVAARICKRFTKYIWCLLARPLCEAQSQMRALPVKENKSVKTDLIINTDTSESSGLNTALGIDVLCYPNPQGSAVMITGFTSDLKSDLLIWF